MAVEAEFVDYDDELTLPVFRPAPEGLTMDFPSPTSSTAVAELADRIFAGLVTPERVKEVERHRRPRSTAAVGRAGQGRPARARPARGRTAAAASG